MNAVSPARTSPRHQQPVVGITCDLSETRAIGRMPYAAAVARAGGLPLFLPPLPHLAPAHAALCDAFVLSGGDDPLMEDFGEKTHPMAVPVDPVRQEYELRLLKRLGETRPAAPVLGVCLGMQYMALHAGGRLNQHMPDDVPSHEDHRHDRPHNVRPAAAHPVVVAGLVTSHHRQAVSDPGRLRVLARAEDGVIEAIDDPARAFYLGVQWHPERTPGIALGQAVYDALVRAAAAGR